MKLAAMTSAITLMASGVFAGEVAYSSQSEPMAAGAVAMGDTAAWLIPLIAIALIVLASGSCGYPTERTAKYYKPPRGCWR